MAFLHYNHAYNNPVVNTFVRLMLDSSPYHKNRATATPMLDVRVKLLDDFDSTKSYGGECNFFASLFSFLFSLLVSERKRIQFVPTRVRNRWFVTYTLLRNPSLQQYRTSSLIRGDNSAVTTATSNTTAFNADAAADDSASIEEPALKLSNVCQ